MSFHNLQALHVLTEQQKSRTKSIVVPMNDGLRIVYVNNIIRIAASGSYSHIYCFDNVCITSTRSMKDYEDLLPAGQFFRVHNSHIVNISHILHYRRGDGGYVTMCDNSVIYISKRRKKEFLNLFQGGIV